MTIEAEIQKLEADSLLTMWTVDGTSFGAGVLRFHGTAGWEGPIVWQGQSFAPWAIGADGFARTSEQQPRPKLLVGNLDGSITALCAVFDDMVGAKVTRHRTFLKFLDDVNFPHGANLVPGGGTFDDPSSIAAWTSPAGPTGVSVSGGKLRIGLPVGMGTTAVQFTFPTVAGKTYKFAFDVDASGNSTTYRIGTTSGGMDVLSATVANPGTSVNVSFTGTGGTLYVWLHRTSSATQAIIDNVTVWREYDHDTADPTAEFPPEIWLLERKVNETIEVVEFELVTPLDFQGVQLPRRQIIANQCAFDYRGPYCNYTGGPVADALNNPTSDPELDACSHSLQGCELRDWPDGVLNYGGFPAAGLMRT